ncbi:hypothetical protein [Shewanella waksmanii]|uniref:hypothetical protein n=1 Tax=Shewanella waksmanii TaxID=213783 RepID=UPI00048AB67E|nr:hypothetical protein [Shewanella waksmanii]
MNPLLQKFKHCLFSGLLFVVPLLLFYIMISEIIDLIVSISNPLAEMVPSHLQLLSTSPFAQACALLTVTSLLFGTLLRSPYARQWLTKAEQHTLAKVPLYQAIKSISRGLLGDKTDSSYSTGLYRGVDDSLQWVYIIEESDKYCTILLPDAPCGFSGPVKIVARGRITITPNSVGEVSGVLTQWGQGSLGLSCLAKAEKSDASLVHKDMSKQSM